MMNEMAYQSPLVEIIEVEVEKGFATSSGNIENLEEGLPGSWQ